ncbi:MAG: hypothetical protein E7254_12195 [Lachnospiraceae bacterium]|nr:hypothetical protein [Lachnospiraceae bacterium]
MEKNDRDEVVRFLKSLWNEKPQPCPFCGGELDFLHKKAKKSNCDWICTVCKQKYDTIEMLKRINDE